MTSSAELRRRYVEELRGEGLLSDAEVIRAFGAVPREEFVAYGFHAGGDRWAGPADPDFLTLVYRNHPLVTKVVDGVPVSSSSQPSLMAAMIEGLDLRPGTRVLEIGVGTGYNAALMSTMGARVTAVDIAPDVVDRASAALARVGLADVVDVRLGDGYLGDPANAPYDRIIVTVGLTGVSPRWLDQLAPGGFVLAPVEHAGNHPVLRVWPGGSGVGEVRGLLRAGFMSAAGPLAARYPGAFPEPRRVGEFPEPTVRQPARWRPPLDVFRYHDLWFAVGAWDRRTTFSAGPAGGWGGPGGCVLLDEVHGGGAAILADGSVQAAGAQAGRYAAEALALRDRWVARGRPRISDWRAGPAAPGAGGLDPVLSRFRPDVPLTALRPMFRCRGVPSRSPTGPGRVDADYRRSTGSAGFPIRQIGNSVAGCSVVCGAGRDSGPRQPGGIAGGDTAVGRQVRRFPANPSADRSSGDQPRSGTSAWSSYRP